MNENNIVLDLRKPQQSSSPAEPVGSQAPAVRPVKEDLLITKANAPINLSPMEMEEARKKALAPEENLKWPTPNPAAPLVRYDQRLCYYLNQYGKQVVLIESEANRLHSRMKEFHGDQNGNMTPPRFFKREIVSKLGREYTN